MTATVDPSAATSGLARFLRGEAVAWRDLGIAPEELLTLCADEDLTGLVHRRSSESPPTDWPARLLGDLEAQARAEATREMLRRRELEGALDALAAADIQPLLLKGTALAYQVYDSPAHRPRIDTDLLIRREEVEAARRVMAELGYAAPPYCDGELIFCQFELEKSDRLGVRHVLDFHWKISTQTLFADLLPYDELAMEAVPIPACGVHARAPGLIHALLLACIHPVMHHRSAERLIWLYDIHLLASRLAEPALHRLVDLAVSKGVATICAHQLRLARSRLGTHLAIEAIGMLEAGGRDEPTAKYLTANRRWHDELLSNVTGLRRWSDRVRLLSEVAFPAPSYMLRSYGWSDGLLSRALLPALYAHRGVRGILKVMRGAK